MYIITGGAGFIGSAMVWKLNSLGIDDILVVDNLACTEKWKNLVPLRYNAYMHRSEFLEKVRAGDLRSQVTAVIHMGACSATTERDADFLMQNNLEYTKTLCRFAFERDARFINASSASTYGDGSLGFSDTANLDTLRPLNMYGYSKHLFDVWAQRKGFLPRLASLKFFNVYGPNEQHKGDMRSVVNKSFHTIAATGKVSLFRSCHPDFADGCQMRDFVYIKDCVDIIWWLLQNPAAGGVFNIGTGTARTWLDLATAVFTAMGKPANIEFVPMPEHLLGKYQNFTEAPMHTLRAAGYTAPMTSLEDGVRDYITHYLATPCQHLGEALPE